MTMPKPEPWTSSPFVAGISLGCGATTGTPARTEAGSSPPKSRECQRARICDHERGADRVHADGRQRHHRTGQGDQEPTWCSAPKQQTCREVADDVNGDHDAGQHVGGENSKSLRGVMVAGTRRAPGIAACTRRRSVRRGAFRILYEIDDVIRLVTVLRVEHRADVYRPR